jgi:hypothetical protein
MKCFFVACVLLVVTPMVILIIDRWGRPDHSARCHSWVHDGYDRCWMIDLCLLISVVCILRFLTYGQQPISKKGYYGTHLTGNDLFSNDSTKVCHAPKWKLNYNSFRSFLLHHLLQKNTRFTGSNIDYFDGNKNWKCIAFYCTITTWYNGRCWELNRHLLLPSWSTVQSHLSS